MDRLESYPQHRGFLSLIRNRRALGRGYLRHLEVRRDRARTEIDGDCDR